MGTSNPSSGQGGPVRRSRGPDARDDRYVVYVYTADWQDEPEVMRVREALRALGVADRIGYKRNLETFRGEYSKKGKRVTYYSA